MVNPAAAATDEDDDMGTGGIIGGVLVVLLVCGAVALVMYRRRVTAGSDASGSGPPTGWRLTSDALGRLGTPPWRVVHELPDGVLGDVDHVLVGPIGVLAISTRLSPLPSATDGITDTDPSSLAASAIARADLDEALATVGMGSDLLVDVHWGRNDSPEAAIDVGRDHVAVDGRRIGEWLESLEPRLTPTLVDHAWRTIVTAAGRPDPLGTDQVSPDRTR